MNPAAARAAILICELVVFFTLTAFLSYFISYASALEPPPGEAPPTAFPVVVFDGDRARPTPERYRVVTWSEWEKLAAARPDATLLLPSSLAAVRFGDASVTVAAREAEARQTIGLRWRTGGGEQEARYIAQARGIEPLYLRTLGTQTLLTSALAGFVASLFLGRMLRRRWLAQPGYLAPGPK